MKYNQLYAELEAAGCYIVRKGGEHNIWFSPKLVRNMRFQDMEAKKLRRGLT